MKKPLAYSSALAAIMIVLPPLAEADVIVYETLAMMACNQTHFVDLANQSDRPSATINSRKTAASMAIVRATNDNNQIEIHRWEGADGTGLEHRYTVTFSSSENLSGWLSKVQYHTFGSDYARFAFHQRSKQLLYSFQINDALNEEYYMATGSCKLIEGQLPISALPGFGQGAG